MSTLASQLREIVAYIHGYYLIPIFIFGIAGNLMNVIIFSRNTLKHTTCSLYFISLSIIHVFVLCFGCLTRIVITLSGFDLTRYSLFFCKFRVYFFVAGIAISRYYLCLISIDRWLVTSLNAPTRRLSNFPIIRRILIISTIAWLIFNLHVPIGFRQEANGCVPSSDGFYLTFYLVTNLNFAIVPFVIIILFSTLTLQRVTKRKLIRKHNAIVYPIGPVERTAVAGPPLLKNDPKRPVAKVASELGILPEQFIACFNDVQPAPQGSEPTAAQVHAKKEHLLSCLQKVNSAITNELLDAVMDKYRAKS
ncbi:hypothetical protein I4U23_023253 [Adineta vaga]|nr:hypothetical protein I4U23_023253 [Adineta vaga]